MESRGVTPEGERILGYRGVMPIVEEFTDISGRKREILRVNGEYMVILISYINFTRLRK